MSKFTKGPWAVNWAGSGRNGEFVYDEVYVYAPACGVDDVAVAADIVDPVTGKPSAENGRLIAAAPELLEALIAYTKAYDENPHLGPRGSAVDQAFGIARAAIAKATGEKA